jgi:hypothetical protein
LELGRAFLFVVALLLVITFLVVLFVVAFFIVTFLVILLVVALLLSSRGGSSSLFRLLCDGFGYRGLFRLLVLLIIV